MSDASVQRWIEFDTGHRVARHQSKCSNLHGHRYRLTVTVRGPIRDDDSPEHGMVIDFGNIKTALTLIHDDWDHRFIIGRDDPLMPALAGMPGVVVLECQPTAENLAAIAYVKLSKALEPLKVISVDLQETSSCTATFTL